MTVAKADAPVAPLLVAAVLLLAAHFARRLGLAALSGRQILEATGAKRSRAYELSEQLARLLPGLLRPVGRPPKAAAELPGTDIQALTQTALAYSYDHPGCVAGSPGRRNYSDEFRHFMVQLRGQYPHLLLEQFAEAVQLPLGTVSGWLAPPAATSGDLAAPSGPKAGATAAMGQAQPDPCPDGQAECARGDSSAWLPQLQSILQAWSDWKGGFSAFCDHVRQHLRIHCSNRFISHLLEVAGVRQPRRRPGGSPDQLANRGSFVTWFPHAQWVADGSALTVVLGGHAFSFNLELVVDCYSSAFIGMAVTDTEDSNAVVQSFEDAKQATATQPIAELLDNRSSNHTEQVTAALGSTLKIRSTPARPQSKPHVEGGFGLLKSSLPPLRVPLGDPRESARSIAQLVVLAYSRGLNHRPRHDRHGRTRAELLHHQPSAEQFAQAQAALQERYRKQQLAQQTRAARQNPQVRAYLDQAFQRLNLDDPDGYVRTTIARYSLSVIVDAIALFEVRLRDPQRALDDPPRYLLGIVRNLAHESDGLQLADQLTQARLAARDALLTPLQDERDALLNLGASVDHTTCTFVQRAVASHRQLDRLFWLREAAALIRHAPDDQQSDLLHTASLLIHTTHRLSYRQRGTAFRFLADSAILLN